MRVILPPKGKTHKFVTLLTGNNINGMIHAILGVPRSCNWAKLTLFISPSQAGTMDKMINSSAPTRFEWNFRWFSSQFQWLMAELSLVKLPSDECHWTLLNKSSLVQVMAWCYQATSRYLIQCWPRSMSPMASLGHNELTSATCTGIGNSTHWEKY